VHNNVVEIAERVLQLFQPGDEFFSPARRLLAGKCPG
jgi:hypothetical protein